MDTNEQCMKEAIGKNNELDIEEMDLQKNIADLSRSLVEQEKIIQNLLVKVENTESKVFFKINFFTKGYNWYHFGNSNIIYMEYFSVTIYIYIIYISIFVMLRVLS